jgi:hypothetical protein
MPPQRIEESYFSPDTLEFIRLLHAHNVRYMVVGGEAVIYYGHARLTGDIDFFYEASPENTAALFQALKLFWSGNIPGVQRVEELQEEGIIIQFGRPPNRIDLLNRIDGITFSEAWRTRVIVPVRTTEGELPLLYLGLPDLIRNKEACARPKDLDDLSFLRKLQH